jgi:damage-control phosphatase, subfamily III
MTKGSTDNSYNKIVEGKQLIRSLSELKAEMSRDRPLRFIPDDRGVDISVYNNELQALITLELNTWFTAPWLFAECVTHSQIPIF